VAFNINVTDKWQDDIDLIKTAFPQVYVFRCPMWATYRPRQQKRGAREAGGAEGRSHQARPPLQDELSFVNVVRSLRP